MRLTDADLSRIEALAGKATPGPYFQGVTLLTPKTATWSQEQLDRNNSIERKMVFARFSSQDQGRSRIHIGTLECDDDSAMFAALPPDTILALVREVRAFRRHDTEHHDGGLRDALFAEMEQGHGDSLWTRADWHLAEAQKLVEEAQANNEDGYGLLQSAHESIIQARGDLDSDLK